jgi:hypothetical protein
MSGHVKHRAKCNWPFGSFVRHLIEGACNEPEPWNWYSACRRRAGHPGAHHTWDPRTGIDHARHPYAVYDEAGRRFLMVTTYPGPNGPVRQVRALRGHGAYVGGPLP